MARLRLLRAPGKYVQGSDALLDFYKEASFLGENFLFISSNSGLKACHDKLEQSFEGSQANRYYEKFNGISSVGEINRFRDMIKEKSIDVVVGVGGGSAIDTAKAAAYHEKKKIAVIPTVAATDAPCTGLSVIYQDDGSFDSYLFYPQNPDLVLVDSQVIANSPVDFLVAGMGDALATYIEALACQKFDAPSLENGGVTRSALALCKLCFETLMEYGEEAKIACEKKIVTPALDYVIEAAIYLSGVGADNGGLAVAHSVYNGSTGLEECEKAPHGAVVAYGTLTQLILEGADPYIYEDVFNFCESVGLPTTLEQLGITDPERLMILAEKACAPGESIHNMIPEISPRQLADAMIMVDAYTQANRI